MITNRVEYLLLILLDLAEHKTPGYVLSREVAERQGIPSKYMPQLMAVLTRKGWVDSVRGARGGVRLATDPKDITVKDVIEAAGERFLVKPCVDDGFPCSRKDRCVLRPVWTEAQDQVDRVMGGVTLAALIESQDRKNEGR